MSHDALGWVIQPCLTSNTVHCTSGHGHSDRKEQNTSKILTVCSSYIQIGSRCRIFQVRKLLRCSSVFFSITIQNHVHFYEVHALHKYIRVYAKKNHILLKYLILICFKIPGIVWASSRVALIIINSERYLYSYCTISFGDVSNKKIYCTIPWFDNPFSPGSEDSDLQGWMHIIVLLRDHCLVKSPFPVARNLPLVLNI